LKNPAAEANGGNLLLPARVERFTSTRAKDGKGLVPAIEPGGKTSGRTAGLSCFSSGRAKLLVARSSLGNGLFAPFNCGTLAR
jgi:hypothetical protein